MRLCVWHIALSGNWHFCTHRIADVDIDACVQTLNDLLVGAGTGGAQKTEDTAYLGRSLQHHHDIIIIIIITATNNRMYERSGPANLLPARR